MGKEGKYDLQLASVVNKKDHNEDGNSESEVITENDHGDVDIMALLHGMNGEAQLPLVLLQWTGSAMLQVRVHSVFIPTNSCQFHLLS